VRPRVEPERGLLFFSQPAGRDQLTLDVELLTLAHLDESAVAELLDKTEAHAVDVAFSRACHHATGGNPFLLAELVVALHEQQVPFTAAGAKQVAEITPPQVARATRARLARLDLPAAALARATAVLDQLGLNILDARITPVGNGFSLDSYHVLEDDGSAITDRERLMEIEQALWGSLQRPEEAPLAVSRRATRQMRVFKTPTQIAISVDERNRRSVLELTAADRPGLLCDVGKVLWEERVDLHAAKISTLGERAEDVFYLTDREMRPLNEAAAERLRVHLSEALDRRLA